MKKSILKELIRQEIKSAIKRGEETDNFLSGYYDSSTPTKDGIGFNQGVETDE